MLVRQIETGGVAPAAAEIARQRDFRMRQAGWPSCCASFSTALTGSATSSSSGRVLSAIRLTKEVLAPFSSRRRTRYASSVSWVPTGA